MPATNLKDLSRDAVALAKKLIQQAEIGLARPVTQLMRRANVLASLIKRQGVLEISTVFTAKQVERQK
jgi:hypothetical protein